MNKKIFGLVLSGMLCVGMVGCGDEVKESFEEGYEDATKQEEQVEEPKEEVAEPDPIVEEEQPEVTRDISTDVDGAYTLLKPMIDQQFGSLDHDYMIMDDGLYLVGYLSSNEVYYGMSDGTWAELVSQAEYASNNMKEALNAAGYTNVSFNVSMCDNVKRQDLCFLLVRDGYTFYNIADEMQ